MKTIDTFEELDEVSDIALRDDLRQMLGYLTDDVENIPASISEYAGGSIYIIETAEDLKEIATNIEGADGNWANITEVADSFDMCEYRVHGTYACIMFAANNTGGPTYAIPRHIANACPNVAESVRMTRVAWGLDSPSTEDIATKTAAQNQEFAQEVLEDDDLDTLPMFP